MSKHEHDIVENISEHCQSHGMRLTEPRRLVLEIISSSDKPIGAYAILAELGKAIENPKPTTVYRAIAFLQENHFIHKIESLNAFVICHAGHLHKGSQFMICDDCGTVQEAHVCHLPDTLEKKLKNTGFALRSWNTELHGTCSDCKSGH